MTDSCDMDLHVFHRSYFCGKMLGYMRYKQIPHRVIHSTWADIGDEMLEHTGLKAFPVIRLRDGRWMSDTTPMILWLEQKYPHHSVLPEDAVTRFFVRLVEDYADEWMWRPAILSRWQNASERGYYAEMFPREIAGKRGLTAKIFSKLTPWHMNRTFLFGDGVTAQNIDHVWSIYTDTLARLEKIFETHPYLLGDKPSMADFGFFGSMFWHFSSDPAPSRIMHERAPGVNEWVARMWNAKGDRLSDGSFNTTPGQAPETWKGLIKDICDNYLPYLAANARAFAQGKKRLRHNVAGHVYPNMRTSIYRVRCLEVLQAALRDLDDTAKASVKAAVSPDAWQILTTRPELESSYDPEILAPFAKPTKVSTWRKMLFDLGGSAPHVRHRAWDTRG